jgi:D-3-phosphoglycerate dehydrogenase
MKKSAILINTSRGSVIEERSLLTALKNGNISGAAIDVIENEYNIGNNMLIKYAQENQNLIITPHIGGNTWESFEKTEMFLANQLLLKLKQNG